MKTWLVGLLAVLFIAAITVPVFADCWAAMALNQNKKTAAIAVGPTLAEAQKDAMQQAGMPGSSIWTWCYNKFLAMAADQSNPGTFGMDLGVTQEEADNRALSMCQKMGGKNCRVVTRGGCSSAQNPGSGGWQAPRSK